MLNWELKLRLLNPLLDLILFSWMPQNHIQQNFSTSKTKVINKPKTCLSLLFSLLVLIPIHGIYICLMSGDNNLHPSDSFLVSLFQSLTKPCCFHVSNQVISIYIILTFYQDFAIAWWVGLRSTWKCGSWTQCYKCIFGNVPVVYSKIISWMLSKVKAQCYVLGRGDV